MSTHAGSKPVLSSLSLSIDGANPRSTANFSEERKRNSGISSWFCLENATVTYSCIYPNTTIYARDSLGNVSTVVTPSTLPQRGTFSATAGFSYFGSKAIYLIAEGLHSAIVPETLAGTSFCFATTNRGTPGTITIFSPYQNATVRHYDSTLAGAGGMSAATPTATISVSRGTVGTITYNTQSTNHYVSSDFPVLVSIKGAGPVDMDPLSPLERVVYNRYTGVVSDIFNGTSFTALQNGVSSSNVNLPLMNTTLADGSGLDAAQGIGRSFLSNTYCFGNLLSDYVIIAPNTNSIAVSFWTGTQWTVFETHNLVGTELSPVRVARSGATGVGVEASSIGGNTLDLNTTATLWKFEGTDVFYVGVNDTADDEISLCGWMSSRSEENFSSNPPAVFDVSGSRSALLEYNPNWITYSGKEITFSRNAATPKIGGSVSISATGALSSSQFLYNDFTWEILFRINNRLDGNSAYAYGANEGESVLAVYRGFHSGFMYTSTRLGFLMWNSSGVSTFTNQLTVGASGANIIQGQWYHIAVSKNASQIRLYLNGVLSSTFTGSYVSPFSGISNDLTFGSAQRTANADLSFSYFSESSLAMCRMYSREFSA